MQENTNWQIFGLLVTLTVSLQFIVSFLQYGISVHRVSVWGHDYSGMLGVILFNYSLVLAMPAVLAEKKPNVKTTSVVTLSVVVTTFLYVTVGALGAMCMSKVNINMLKPMVSGAFGDTLQWSGWFFAFFIIGLDIPLFSVLTRYANLDCWFVDYPHDDASESNRTEPFYLCLLSSISHHKIQPDLVRVMLKTNGQHHGCLSTVGALMGVLSRQCYC